MGRVSWAQRNALKPLVQVKPLNANQSLLHEFRLPVIARQQLRCQMSILRAAPRLVEALHSSIANKRTTSTPSTSSSTRAYPTGETPKYPTAPATPRATTLTTPASCSTVLRGTGEVKCRRTFVRPIISYRNRAGKCLTWSSVIWLARLARRTSHRGAGAETDLWMAVGRDPRSKCQQYALGHTMKYAGSNPVPPSGPDDWSYSRSIFESAHTLRLRMVALHSPESNSSRLYAAINCYLPTSTLMF